MKLIKPYLCRRCDNCGEDMWLDDFTFTDCVVWVCKKCDNQISACWR